MGQSHSSFPRSPNPSKTLCSFRDIFGRIVKLPSPAFRVHVRLNSLSGAQKPRPPETERPGNKSHKQALTGEQHTTTNETHYKFIYTTHIHTHTQRTDTIDRQFRAAVFSRKQHNKSTHTHARARSGRKSVWEKTSKNSSPNNGEALWFGPQDSPPPAKYVGAPRPPQPTPGFRNNPKVQQTSLPPSTWVLGPTYHPHRASHA